MIRGQTVASHAPRVRPNSLANPSKAIRWVFQKRLLRHQLSVTEVYW